MQIQLLRGREKGDSETRRAQLPKGPFTKLKTLVVEVVLDSDGTCLILHMQYTLSQETIEALKKPTFDVWHWEHNEVCH